MKSVDDRHSPSMTVWGEGVSHAALVLQQDLRWGSRPVWIPDNADGMRVPGAVWNGEM